MLLFFVVVFFVVVFFVVLVVVVLVVVVLVVVVPVVVVLVVVVSKEEKEGDVIYTKRFHGVCSFLGRWCGDGMSTESTEVVDGLVLHFLCDG